MENTGNSEHQWLKPRKQAKIKVGNEFQALIPDWKPKEEVKTEAPEDENLGQNKGNYLNNWLGLEYPEKDSIWMKPTKSTPKVRIGENFQADIPTCLPTTAEIPHKKVSEVPERKRENHEEGYTEDVKRPKIDEQSS